MRLRSATGGTISLDPKSITDFRSGAEKRRKLQRGLKINFREIFRVVRFSTFATISAQLRTFPSIVGLTRCREIEVLSQERRAIALWEILHREPVTQRELAD